MKVARVSGAANLNNALLRFRLFLLFLLAVLTAPVFSQQAAEPGRWTPYDESEELLAQQAHENQRMRFRFINSRYLDKNTLWDPFAAALADFGADQYDNLKPLILEADIPSLQRAVAAGDLDYETLVLFYLYRIRQIESDNTRSLNALIAINPRALEIARSRDLARASGLAVDELSVFGIPVLLKDNIGKAGIPTTAGALALRDNLAGNAFVTDQLEARGAVILGKANLSEWAYFFCDGCPLGYSAMGGQTLSPYGRKQFETGGSSSGSAVAVAANLVAVAVGSETSGSILSPASLNSSVGLKPTTGVLSRTGVVPIAGSLDTVGPITRSVTDAVILFNAMTGYDSQDPAMPRLAEDMELQIRSLPLAGVRLGYLSRLADNPDYQSVLAVLTAAGALLEEIILPETSLPRFGEFLAAEMQRDLPNYLASQAAKSVTVANVADVVAFNGQDMEQRAPYGQALFDQMVATEYPATETRGMLAALRGAGGMLLSQPLATRRLDAILSMNNFHAGFAAAANFPALTLPVGLRDNGQPVGLTLIAPGYAEQTLVDLALAIEALLQGRRTPAAYQ